MIVPALNLVAKVVFAEGVEDGVVASVNGCVLLSLAVMAVVPSIFTSHEYVPQDGFKEGRFLVSAYSFVHSIAHSFSMPYE